MKTIVATQKLLTKALCASIFLIPVSKGHSQSFVEGFDTIANLWTQGWDSVNHSTTYGNQIWLQGNVVGAGLTGMPCSGPLGSFIGSTYQAIHFNGILSVWLIAPLRML